MTLSVIDKDVVRQAQVFVAWLPCSDLTYAEASWTRTPDKLRTEAAALGLAIGTYVDRLLDARELCGASQWFGKLTIYALASRLSASCMAAITAEQVPIRSRYRL